jgi:hypothetical protein
MKMLNTLNNINNQNRRDSWTNSHDLYPTCSFESEINRGDP